jgi:hypothetical protein
MCITAHFCGNEFENCGGRKEAFVYALHDGIYIRLIYLSIY